MAGRYVFGRVCDSVWGGEKVAVPLDSSGRSKGEGTSLGTKIPLEFSENLNWTGWHHVLDRAPIPPLAPPPPPSRYHERAPPKEGSGHQGPGMGNTQVGQEELGPPRKDQIWKDRHPPPLPRSRCSMDVGDWDAEGLSSTERLSCVNDDFLFRVLIYSCQRVLINLYTVSER